MGKRNDRNQTPGQRIYSLRNKYGISLRDLASMTLISEETLKKYEKNILTQIPSNQIEKLALALHIPAGYLLYGKAGMYDELNIAGNHMSVEDNLYDGCIDADDDAVEVFWAMADKTPEERDTIIDSGAFNDHIEGYLTFALRYIGYPESEINHIRSTLRDNIFNHVTAEDARKTGSYIGITRKEPLSADITEKNNSAIVYTFPKK